MLDIGKSHRCSDGKHNECNGRYNAGYKRLECACFCHNNEGFWEWIPKWKDGVRIKKEKV